MRKSDLLATACLTLAALGGAQAQDVRTLQPRVVNCDVTPAPRSPLQVQDEASARGARVENPVLITLPNGMKAVQFSVRHVRSPDPFNPIIKVRYTVHWTDHCGRTLKVGSPAVDGLVLDPRRQEIVQSTAMHPDAAHAVLRIYVD
ncbi:MAG TPA: hypothetical protein VKY60_01965 [Burkholderiaceae bacterium]|nr:hypothetical protein [Burkholderiaceae bacterium]